jgi:hypothetical protein
LAKENYQYVLDSNPNDKYAKAQLVKCDMYLKSATTLNVSPQDIRFSSSGGIRKITLTTNATTYRVFFLPDWCTISKYLDYFIVTCEPHTENYTRKEEFMVTAGGNEIWINISQSGFVPTNRNTAASNNYPYKPKYRSRKCFNCPNAKYSWGLSVGYISKVMDSYSDGDLGYDNKIDGFQFGVRYEPLFKYGFGLDLGLHFEYYHTSFENRYGDYFKYDYQEYAVNIPLHLEYRFNFSKYFNVFAYGGLGLDLITNFDFSDFATNTLLEYGGGLRINHVQFNIGQSLLLKNFTIESFDGTNLNKYKNPTLSISYMF